MQVVIKELWRHRPRDADRLVVIGNDSGDVLHIGAEEVIVQDRRRWLRWPFRRAVAGPRKQT
jgi:hypothetical protein